MHKNSVTRTLVYFPHPISQFRSTISESVNLSNPTPNLSPATLIFKTIIHCVSNQQLVCHIFNPPPFF